MHKVISFFIVSLVVLTVSAQYPGFTLITNTAKFKEQFAVAAKKNNSIKSDFTQEKNLSMLSEKIVSKGKFWFKKDNMVRLEYTQPYKYLMIINKNNIYIKDGQKENKISTGSNKIFKQINKITVECVQGTVLDNTDFSAKIFENKGSYLVELIPVSKSLKDFFAKITVIIDKNELTVTSIETSEKSGDNTTLHFFNKELNSTIPDAVFFIK